MEVVVSASVTLNSLQPNRVSTYNATIIDPIVQLYGDGGACGCGKCQCFPMNPLLVETRWLQELSHLLQSNNIRPIQNLIFDISGECHIRYPRRCEVVSRT